MNTELSSFENRTNTEITDINILVSEIVDILSSLKVNKVSGPDGISLRMFKNTCKTITIPLCKLLISHSKVVNVYIHVYGSPLQLCQYLGKEINRK